MPDSTINMTAGRLMSYLAEGVEKAPMSGFENKEAERQLKSIATAIIGGYLLSKAIETTSERPLRKT